MRTESILAPLPTAPQVQILRFIPTNTSPAFWATDADLRARQPRIPPGSKPPDDDGVLIYVVDDMPCITELYSLVLGAVGHTVKAFNHRAAALEALRENVLKPDLLIMDYRNASMPAEKFMLDCLAIHPAIRILMASGMMPTSVHLIRVRPHRFLQKPFTPEELRQEVKATLIER